MARKKITASEADAMLLQSAMRSFAGVVKTRMQADPETKREMRKIIGDLGYYALSLQEGMIMGEFPYIHELFQDCMDLVIQAIGRPPQRLEHTDGEGRSLQPPQILVINPQARDLAERIINGERTVLLAEGTKN